MFAISSITVFLAASIMAIKSEGTPIVTSSTPMPCARSNIFAQIRDMVSILSNVEVPAPLNVRDAGPCFENSTLAEIQRSLDTVNPCNATAVEIATSHALAKVSKIINRIIQNSALSDDTIQGLRRLDRWTNFTLTELNLATNMTSPEVTIGQICRGHTDDNQQAESEFLSAINGIKNVFDIIKSILNQRN